MTIDLRSDTVTQPTAAMRSAMASATVGDAVIDTDPTTEQLERRTAQLLGKEAALFMPSGSMTNQIAVRVHCQPGDEFLCEAGCHIYNYEQGAFAQLSGLVGKTIVGDQSVLRVEHLAGQIRPDNEHMLRTRLLTIENTHNRGGGRLQPFDTVQEVCRWAHENHLKCHLDGARLWNAAVASGIEERRWADLFDTVSVCFSKGLGAPVGSCLAGPSEWILRARRARKLFGGGMRQSGIIAAGALYGLEHHRDRLAEDHEHAQRLAAAIRDASSIELEPDLVETNIVIFRVDPHWGTAQEFASRLAERDVLVLAFGPQSIRMVTHLDVSSNQIDAACDAIKQVAASACAGSPVGPR